jgi:predicted DNA-binding transcriptional regulator AlpA
LFSPLDRDEVRVEKTNSSKSMSSTAVPVETAEQQPKPKRAKRVKSAVEYGQDAAGLAADTDHHQHDGRHVRGTRAPPIRLLNRHEVCTIANVSYPTVWQWMRDGNFPRSRIVGGKSMWLSSEIEAWLSRLPLRPLKGDVLKAGKSIVSEIV